MYTRFAPENPYFGLIDRLSKPFMHPLGSFSWILASYRDSRDCVGAFMRAHAFSREIRELAQPRSS